MQRSPHFLIPAEAGNLSVDQTQGVSLYIQVANILRYAILSGAIAPGSRLPTVVELGDHFKVARITIREAIRVLAEEGLLVSSRGRGIHVLQHPSQSKPAPQIADAMDADVSSVEIVILAVDDLTTVPADMLKEAIAFPTYKGITKIHKFEGRPLGLIRICVADSIYRRLPKGAIEKKKVLPMVRALPAVGALELKLIITVEPADVVLADHLRCPLGAPVARVLRRAIDTKGRGVYLRVLVMLKREGWEIGKQRVYRLYRLEGLQLRMKVKRRKRISLQRGRPVPATGPNQNWSMDFVHDQMLDGRAFQVLTVIDQWSRESVTLEANFRLTGRCVGKALDEAALQRGWPKAITVDNGTEFTSKALDEWAWRRGVKLDYTRPGKPTDNGLIESFNGRLRDEFLNVNEFITMQDAREKLKAWQHDYNHHRPHGSLGHLTPSEFVKKRPDQQLESRPTPV